MTTLLHRQVIPCLNQNRTGVSNITNIRYENSSREFCIAFSFSAQIWLTLPLENTLTQQTNTIDNKERAFILIEFQVTIPPSTGGTSYLKRDNITVSLLQFINYLSTFITYILVNAISISTAVSFNIENSFG